MPILLGNDLIAARKTRGWTREQLADYSKVSIRTIEAIEQGRRVDIRATTWQRIEKALNETPTRAPLPTAFPALAIVKKAA